MTDWMCSNDHIKDFIIFVSPYHEFLVILFCCSLLLLAGAVISITWLNATRTEALILSCVWGFVIVFMAIVYAHVSGTVVIHGLVQITQALEWKGLSINPLVLLYSQIFYRNHQLLEKHVDAMSKKRATLFVDKIKKNVSQRREASSDYLQVTEGALIGQRWRREVRPLPESCFLGPEPPLPGAVTVSISN